ncbi:Ig-like domain-containing protein [Flavobacterium sp. MAH-1]|uniref:Ig-like domain-containing protein n=1 Tax=Flavobacterium agri TaxID=2743471 RepID=A0A7Y8Y0Q5_9FLAO|nr:Ig-like domain-containing protein [Flavobacterium agri]NUY80439.1 Ig-like domain-containing protein [Flavobacterium agri]NYA70464.1 Ig-like domain-containing protein [Flavobacterium agri]
MKSNFKTLLAAPLLLCIIALAVFGCENDPDDFEPASYSKNPEVFIDTFSSGLIYSSYGGAVADAFQVDTDVTYNNSAASMRFDVPNVNDPSGSYAGGSFYTSVGRDLTKYDALTFWAKSSVAATIDVVGFGNDFGDNKYQASITGLQISTAWRKYIIPIPDAAKLTAEKGMFFISEGPENGNGYTFWVDEVKFEKLGTITPQQPQIFNGQDVVQTSYAGVTTTIDGLVCAFNMPNGINQIVNVTPAYFTFTSSNQSVATVNEQGIVTTVGAGTAVITATVGGVDVLGSLTINSAGTYVHAPTPTQNPSNVISIFSDAYQNVPVNYYNGFWEPYQTTQSADFAVNGDNVLNYTNFNFVGIEFSSPTVDATGMSHMHLDLYIPNALPPGSNFKVGLVDFGADGAFGGGNDTNFTLTFTAPTLISQNWVSLNIPLANFTGLANRAHLGQIILEGANITNFYADNIYFYNDGSVIPPVPTAAAPTPSYPASDVISIFSDAYTNVAGSNLNPNWGQLTVVSQVPIAGNNTLKYAGLNYQGLQLASGLDVSSKNFLHLDYYSANSSALNVYLISTGPVEKLQSLTVPTTSGWNSIDIPLSSFAPVNLTDVIQLKFDGNGDIYLDNILFRN